MFLDCSRNERNGRHASTCPAAFESSAFIWSVITVFTRDRHWYLVHCQCRLFHTLKSRLFRITFIYLNLSPHLLYSFRFPYSTKLRAFRKENHGSVPDRDKDSFQTGCESHSASCSMVPGALSLGIKRPGCKAFVTRLLAHGTFLHFLIRLHDVMLK